MRRIVCVGGLVCALASAAAAHDTWLIADRHVAEEGDKVWLSFVTGEVFPFGDNPTDPDRVAEFVDLHGGRRTFVSGYAPQDNGLSVRGPIEGRGIHVFACALAPRLIELDPATFESYLRSEHADAAVSIWSGRSDRAAAAVERYTKYTKTIVEVLPAAPADRGYEAVVGHRLEIVPTSNPRNWKSGMDVGVRVLLDGHPWAGVSVTAGHDGLAKHEYAVETRTGPDGTARIPFMRPGHWFIKAHLIRPTGGIGRAGWESFWASLTFRVGGIADVSDTFHAIRRIHGELSPAAVAGYRMGQRALDMLGLERGAGGLHVAVYAPLETSHAGVADGIQASTNVSVGRLSLVLREAPEAELRVVFAEKRTGRSLTARLRPEVVSALTGPPEEAESRAMKIATMEDGEIFSFVRGGSEGSGDAVISRRDAADSRR